MTRRKSVCLKWTLVLVLVIFCPYVYSRPQESSQTVVSTSSSLEVGKAIEDLRGSSQKIQEEAKKVEISSVLTATLSPNIPRDVKNKVPVIGESIKVVASQLLEKPSNSSETPIVIDTRIPPKLKTKLAHKHKIKTRNEDGEEPIENSHAGIAVPVTMEELETENKLNNMPSESSTSNEGISTWILLSNTANKENATVPTEATKTEEPQKKAKPSPAKNKTKRPQNNKTSPNKRPMIGSTNKSDLVAGGSAINENVFNKIKDTVLSNVQKNKNTSQRSTITTTTTSAPTTETTTTRKEITKNPATISAVKVTSKPKKNKNKPKSSTTEAPVMSDSAMLPMEPKEQEIELEVSTPPTTTKKPKRSSTKKKTKTKKRKTTKPKLEAETAITTEVKTANKTKSTKVSKKPATTAVSGPITTQIYNYLSREVMPSVGVGMLGLASLVGIASYFLYPFTSPVRRTFEVDKKDDIYRNNAEEYASEGNGQAEEEMLGTVLAGMPAHSKQKLNPYAAQTPHINRYQVKKDQDIRYRQVATKYDPNYNVRYPQQKTGIAHAAVYAEPVNYNHHQQQQYETRHAYTTEVKYDKGPSSYAPYPAVEPIYAAPQTGPSGLSAYGSDSSSSVVYGVKPSSDSDFKPVYPYEAQFYSETTSSPVTYSPTSMYLGSNSEEEDSDSEKFSEDSNVNTGSVDNKFVVGNIPKELTDSATPAVVPEHGPRNLERRRRNSFRNKRSIVTSIDDLLKAAKENKDIFISNEIDETLGMPTKATLLTKQASENKDTARPTRVIPVYAVSVDPTKEETSTDAPNIIKTEFIESVSTMPIDSKPEKTTDPEMSNELDITTKAFRIYEVFSSSSPTAVTEKSSPLVKVEINIDSTTQSKNMNTETTTEFKSETTSTMPPSPSPVSEFTTTVRPTYYPEVITYPPLNQEGGFFSFLKRLVEFKYRLGLSLLQTTSDSLTRYLNSMKDTVENTAKASL